MPRSTGRSERADDDHMLERRVILIGGGGHAGVVLDVCQAAGLHIVGCMDDNPDCALANAGIDWLGPIDTLIDRPADADFVVAVGDLTERARVIGMLEPDHISQAVAHPSAVVSPGASLGRGVVVLPGAIINRNAVIGHHAIINSGAVVEHDCVIGANTHVAPGAVLGGGVMVGERTLIGIRAAVLPGKKIGTECVIGAGAVVTGDVSAGEQFVGVPARAIGVSLGG